MIDFSISFLPFIIIGVGNFIVSWLYYSPVAPWFKTWQIGVGAIIGFAVTHSLNTQFEGRKPIVLVINNVLYLLTYVVFGGIIAVIS